MVYWKYAVFFGSTCNNWRNGSCRKWKLCFFTNLWSKLHATTTFWCHKSAVKNQQCNLYFLNLCSKVETAKDSKTFTYSALIASHWLSYFALYLISPCKFSVSRSLVYFFICIILENLFLVVCKFGFLWDISVLWTPLCVSPVMHLHIFSSCNIGANHGGTRGTCLPRIWSGDANANCPPTFKKRRAEFTRMTFQVKNSFFSERSLAPSAVPSPVEPHSSLRTKPCRSASASRRTPATFACHLPSLNFKLDVLKMICNDFMVVKVHCLSYVVNIIKSILVKIRKL